ncbi:FAD-dependent monooxygenase [Bordetella sp. BOR01]|uniref:FAD-dependent monooxygenase n=1 Tax=Bordetella sp. BOR01 TaxID=2854779 RepID=UPI001C439F01|nr:FAD-dependent monooxygenase [Bordetella sp. BOR01]MBV7485462.1 FAD-dependent monooxygenase [Bordetella sp. BOR01]
MNSPKVLISGAGIGGLTAALCLVQRGFDVTVLEQAAELKAVGAGLQLSANATRVLDDLGLGPALADVTIKPGGKYVRLWNTGQEWQLFDLGTESLVRYGHSYMMLYRPDLHGILAQALESRAPGSLKLGAKVVDVGQDAHGVHAVLADGTRHAADVLVGADGVHSVTRARLIAEDHPRFSGCIAWRGVIPLQALPASMQGTAGVNWVGPGAHVIHYPVHAGKLVSFTGIVEKDGWGRESWTEQGSTEECLDDFKGWHADVQALVRQLHAPLRWAMMVRDPLENWTNGRVTLLGDAAHPTLPFLAQGAGMAIEDGCVIARALQAYRDDPAYALQAYQATRLERTTRIVNGSAANTKRFHNPELAHASGAAAYIEREWAEDKVRQRYEWLFSYEPENVPLASPRATATGSTGS